MPSSCYPNSPFPFISPSSFLAYLKQTLTSSLNFIPSCCALFLIYFPISQSEVCLIPVEFYPGSSSTPCSCYNFLFCSKGLCPKGNRSCFLVKLAPSALPSIFSVPAAGIQLASTMHSLQPVTLPKYLLMGGESCWRCGASGEACDGLYISEQLRWLYHCRITALLSQQMARSLFCWPSRRAEWFASSWLINLHATGHDGEGICHALLFGKQLAEFQLL